MGEGEQQLPDEVLLAILCHVARDDVRALCQATAVCRRWYAVGQDNDLWALATGVVWPSPSADRGSSSSIAQGSLRQSIVSHGKRRIRWRAAYDGHMAGVKEHYPTAPPDVKATKADGLRSVCLLGESGTGKTCLAITMFGGVFPQDYIPRVFDNYSPGVRMDYNRLVVWDTADGYLVDEELRAKVYQEAHVFVLFFDLHDRRSYDQITAKWVKEVKPYMLGSVRLLLVGTKLDLVRDVAHMPLRDHLRNNVDSAPEHDVVTFAEGWRLAEDIGAIGFVPVSALADLNTALVVSLVKAAPMMPARSAEQRGDVDESKGKGKNCTLS